MKSTLNALRLAAAAALVMSCATLASGQTIKRMTHPEAVEAAKNKPTPEYSSMAKQLRVQGNVQVNAYISEDGKVERTEAVSGNPLLIKCAEEALRKWTFQPITDDGKPVKAVANLTFSFKL
jgi:TonB family protein